MMHALAAIGFHQSYTYFTWRNTAAELTEYLTELSGPAAPYMRPNFFVNTPDILCHYLQHAGPAAFAVRAVLAAMMAPSFGRLLRVRALREHARWCPAARSTWIRRSTPTGRGTGIASAALGLTIAPLLTKLNAIRRAHPALQWLRNLRFHYSDQPDILCFSKHTGPDFPGGPRHNSRRGKPGPQ